MRYVVIPEPGLGIWECRCKTILPAASAETWRALLLWDVNQEAAPRSRRDDLGGIASSPVPARRVGRPKVIASWDIARPSNRSRGGHARIPLRDGVQD